MRNVFVFVSRCLVVACVCVACGNGENENSFAIKGASGTDGATFSGSNTAVPGNGGSNAPIAGSGVSIGFGETNTESASPTIPFEIKDYVRELVDSGSTQGVVVALIDDDGVTYHSYGKTAVDCDPVDEHTLFEIGSITKIFTNTLLSDMVEQGKMALDDPVKRYLPPDIPMPGGNSITLQELATHHSGLPRDAFVLTDYYLYNGYTAEQLSVFLSNYTLTRDPGTQFEYSNIRKGLLGYVLSLAANISYEELVINRISQPLEMEDTRITLLEEQRRRLATGHRSDGKIEKNIDLGILAGCGALLSTAADLARFVQANLGLYETALYPALQRTQEPRAETEKENIRVGLGWIVETYSDVEIVWHNGGTAGYHSYCGFNRSQKVGAVVLSNSTSDIDPIGKHMLVSEIELPPIKKTVGVEKEVLENYVGTYRLSPTATVEIALEGDTLLTGVTGLPIPPIKVPMFPESEVDFFSREVDAHLTFEKDDAGRVVALVANLSGVELRAEKTM